MKLNLQDKLGYQIQTKDKVTGKVKDFLFDEDQWKLRYIDVDLGGIFYEQRILIPVQLIHGNWKDKTFTIDLESKHLKSFPELDDHKTVSREFEAKIAEFFKIEQYWGSRFLPSAAPFTYTQSSGLLSSSFELDDRVPARKIKPDDINSSLRSFNEIEGYTFYAKNGKIGNLLDLIIESKNWSIISTVVDVDSISDKPPVIVATKWIEEISYIEKGISLSLKQSEVLSAPTFNVNDSINTQKVSQDFDFTGTKAK